MQIYVGKNGQQLGPFSLEEINRKLADRTFVGTDLAWYEGAAGWAPLSGVSGVVVPAASATPAAAPVTPVTPPPAQPAPAPAPAAIPVRSNAPIVQPPARPGAAYKTVARVGWSLIGLTLLISCIPLLGCGTWILVWPVAVIAIILGIIVLTRGGTGQGVALILAAIVLVPVALIAPVLSTAIFGNAADQKKATQIMENLRTIDGAKGRFVTQTKAADGAPVSMANLTSYLSGKEIKPTVGEQYDPMPVGQAPTATLPAEKPIGGFKGGDVLTVAAIEKDLASGSFTWTSKRSWSSGGTSPTPSVSTASSPKPTPQATAAPAVTASPRPSVSPKPTSPPRSLISPRQSVEPEESESPSTRPSPSMRSSPSAKFAPREGPQTLPRKSPAQPDASGVPRQGKQNPPGEKPAATPDEDDDE